MQITRLIAAALTAAGLSVSAAADPAAYEKMAAYSRARNGYSVLVRQGDKVVFERYHNGWHADKPHRLASGTKSFWGVAAMAAVEDGLLTLDERACDTLTEWKADPQKSRITIRHLLTLSAGLEPAKDVLQAPNQKDKYAEALKVRSFAAPGQRFRYGPSQYYALGMLLKRKLARRKEDPLDYLKRRILDPIGLKVPRWNHDWAGNPTMPSGAWLTAREWSKFGQLVLQDGRWGDEQLVKKSLLDQCFVPSKALDRYGLTWWLDPAKRWVVAAGKGKQKLYVIRSKGLVVVRQGETTGAFDDAAFLGPLLAR